MRRVTFNENGVIAALYEPDGPPKGFAVVLGGSGGGVPERMAERVANAGIAAFGVAYFGLPGLPPALVEVPIETVQRALEVFRDRFAGSGPVGIVGSSKGSELALNVAARVGALAGPVVAAAPSSISWYGLAKSGQPSLAQPSWTWQGSPVPTLAFAQGAAPTFTPGRGMRVDSCYDPAMYPQREVDAASIPVELATGPLLILAGGDDHMWPSAPMAARIADRMSAHGRGADLTTVVYEGASHTFMHHEYNGTPRRAASRFDFGGTREADAAACTDAWSRIGAFLAS
jgi:dienelactone hydrolase